MAVGIASLLALRMLLPVHARERSGTIVCAGCHDSPEDAARSCLAVAEVYAELDDRDRALELYELASELLGPGRATRYLAGAHARRAQ